MISPCGNPLNCSAWTDTLFPQAPAIDFKYPIVYNISFDLAEGYVYYFQVSPANLLGFSKFPATLVQQFGVILGPPAFDYLSSSGASVAVVNGRLQVWQNGNVSNFIELRIMNIPVIGIGDSVSITFSSGNWTLTISPTVVSSYIQTGTLLQFYPPTLPQSLFDSCQFRPVSAVISFPITFERVSSLLCTVTYFCYPNPVLNSVIPSQGSVSGGTVMVVSVSDSSGPLTRQGANLPNFQDVLTKQRNLQIFLKAQTKNFTASPTILSISRASDGSQAIIISSRTPAVESADVTNIIFVIDTVTILMDTSLAVPRFEFVGSKILSVTPGSGALNPGSGGLNLTITVSNILSSETNITIFVAGALCLLYQPLPQPSSCAVGTASSLKCRASELPLSRNGSVEIQVVLPRMENNVLTSAWEYLLPPAAYIDMTSVVIDGRVGQPFWIAYGKLAKVSFSIQNVGALYGRLVSNVSIDQAEIGEANYLQTGDDMQVMMTVVGTGPVRPAAQLFVSLNLETDIGVFNPTFIVGFTVEIQDLMQPRMVALAPSQIPAMETSIFVVGVVSAAELVSVSVSSLICTLVCPSFNISLSLYGVVPLDVWMEGDGQIQSYFPTSRVKLLMGGASEDILSQFQNVPAQTSTAAGQAASTGNVVVVGEIPVVLLGNESSASAILLLSFGSKLLSGSISLAQDPVGPPTVIAQTENNDLRSGLSGNLQLRISLQNFAVVRSISDLLVKFDSTSVPVQRLVQSNTNGTNLVVIVPPSSTVKTAVVTVAAVRKLSQHASFSLQYYDDRIPTISSFSPYQVYSSPGGTLVNVILINFPQVPLTSIVVQIQLAGTIFPPIPASSCVYSSNLATVVFPSPSTMLSGTAVFTISISSSGATTTPVKFQMVSVPSTPPSVVKITPTTGLSSGGFPVTVILSNLKTVNAGDSVVANISLGFQSQQVACVVISTAIGQTTVSFVAPNFPYGGVSSIEIWQIGRRPLSAFFTFLYVDINIPVLDYVYPSSGFSLENVLVQVSISRFGAPSDVGFYSLASGGTQNGSVVGVSGTADGSTILSLNLFRSVPSSASVNYTAQRCVVMESCLSVEFIFGFQDPRSPSISFFSPTSVTTDGRVPISVEMSNLPKGILSSEMSVQISDGIGSFLLNASVSSLQVVAQDSTGNDVNFEFIAPGASGGNPAQGLFVVLKWMDTSSMVGGQAVFPSLFAYTTPPAIRIASVIPSQAFIETASTMVVVIDNFPGVVQMSDIIIQFSNTLVTLEAAVISFSRINPSLFQYAVQDISITLTTPYGSSVSAGLWRLSAYHATYYQRVAILDGFLFTSSASPQTKGMTSATGQTGINSLSVPQSSKTLVTIVVGGVSTSPSSAILGSAPLSLVQADFNPSLSTATAVFYAPSSTCTAPCSPVYGFIAFSSGCTKCADASCCQSATCSNSCGATCRSACFTLNYFDDLLPSILLQSTVQGASTGGTTIRIKIANFPQVQSNTEVVAVFLSTNIQGSVYISSSSSSITDLTIVTPQVDTGGASVLTYSQNALYALARPDMVVTFPFTFNLVVPTVQSVSPSVGVKSGNVLVTVIISNFPYPSPVGLIFGSTLLPDSAVSILPVSNAISTAISFSTLSSASSGQVTCKLFPKSCPSACGQTVTFFFQQIEAFQILSPIPTKNPVMQIPPAITVRLKNVPSNGLFYIQFSNGLGLTILSPTVLSTIYSQSTTSVTFTAPNQVGVYTCSILVGFQGSNTTLTFSYEVYDPNQARIISIQPLQAPTQTQIYGQTLSPRTLVSITVSNFPQGLLPSMIVVSFGAGFYGDVESVQDSSRCSNQEASCNKTLIVILAPSVVVPGNVSCLILSTKVKLSNPLSFTFTYFSACDFATFCASSSLIADAQQVLQTPPSTTDCNAQFCVDPATLPDPELVSFYPSQGQATGGSVVLIGVRNLPILSIQAVLISVGVGAEQVLVRPSSISQNPGANLRSSSSSISFRTVSNPTGAFSSVSNARYTITSSLGPLSKQLSFTFQYTPVIVGNAVVLSAYPTSVQAAVATSVTLQLTNFPQVTAATAFHIIAIPDCGSSDIFRSNAIISSTLSLTIANIVFNVNSTGVCPVKIFWEDFGEEQAGVYNISFDPPPDPVVQSWFPQRGTRGKILTVNVLYWSPLLKLADFHVVVTDGGPTCNITALTYTGPNSCMLASCSEFAISFTIPNLVDEGAARNFEFAIIAAGKSAYLELPIDSQYVPFVVSILPASVMVTETDQTNITIYIGNSGLFCLSNTHFTVLFGVRQGKVLTAAMQGPLCLVTLRAPLISDDSEMSCTLTNSVGSIEFCSSDAAVRLQVVPAPIYMEPVDSVCSGGSAIKFTLVGYSFGALNSSNISVVFGGLSGDSVTIINSGMSQSSFSVLAFNTTTPSFATQSSAITGYVLIRGSRIPFPFLFECFVAPTATVSPSQAALDGTTYAGSKSTTLTINYFPALSTTQDAEVAFNSLVCNGTVCAVLSFQNVANGVILTVGVPAWTVQETVTLTVTFVGAASVPAGGDLTTTYVRTPRVATVSFIFAIPAPVVISSLFCLQCNPGIFCIINSKCAEGQKARPNSVAISGAGVLTIVVGNMPQVRYNISSGHVLAPAAIVVQVGSVFASVRRIIFSDSSLLWFEAKLMGAAATVGSSLVQVTVQPNTLSPIVSTAYFRIDVFDDSVQLACLGLYLCQGSSVMGSSFMVSLSNFPLTSSDVSELITVQFGSILATDLRLVNSTEQVTVLLVTPPNYNCSACQFSDGAAVVSLSVVYSANSLAIAAATYTFWVSPSILTASFDPSGTQILVTFDQDTNRAGMSVWDVSCEGLIQNAIVLFGDDSRCVWTADSALNVFLGTQANIVPGSTLALMLKGGLRSINNISVASTSVAVVTAPVLIPPAVVLKSIGVIDACSALEIRASVASPRPLVSYIWNCINDADFDSYLSSVNGPILSLVSGTPQMQTADKTYSISFSTTNFLGASTTLVVNVLKQSSPAPQVQFNPPSLSITRDQPVLVRGQAVFTSCPVDQGQLRFSWRLVSGPLDFPAASLSAVIPQIYVQPNSLTAGSTYELGLQVSIAGDSSQVSEGIFVLQVGYQLLVAVLDGGSSMVVSSSSKFRLSAARSYDPDVNSGSNQATNSSLSFSWQCTATEDESITSPCRNLNGALLSFSDSPEIEIPDNTLISLITPYMFTVTVMKTGHSPASASMPVYIVADSRPTLTVSTQCTRADFDQRACCIEADGAIFANSNSMLVFSATSDLANTSFFWTLSPNQGPLSVTTAPLGNMSHQFILQGSIRIFVPGNTYTVQLVGSGLEGGSPGQAEQLILINSPPIGGSFSACLVTASSNTEGCTSSGIAVIDAFLLSSIGWTDPEGDSLLQYRFGYFVTSNYSGNISNSTSVVWFDWAGDSIKEISFPSGYIIAVAQVKDDCGAQTDTLQAPVNVLPASSGRARRLLASSDFWARAQAKVLSALQTFRPDNVNQIASSMAAEVSILSAGSESAVALRESLLVYLKAAVDQVPCFSFH